MTLAIYFEATRHNTTRFFLAPPDLGIAQAKAQRRGRWYKTREGARRGLVAALDRDKRESAKT